MQSKKADGGSKINKKIKLLKDLELSTFFEQLYTFTSSGLDVWESLLMVSSIGEKGRNKEVYKDLYKNVIDGCFLSKALNKSGVFPKYAVRMIELAEQTGNMKEVAEMLSVYYKEKDSLSKNIKSAVIYPISMSIMVIGVVYVILMYVSPVFEQIFEQLGLTISPISSFLLNFGATLGRYNVVISIVIVLLAVIFLLLKLTRWGKNILKKMFEKSFLSRKIALMEGVNKFAFSMALMLESGMEINIALALSEDIAENEMVKEKISSITKGINGGESISSAIINSGIFKDEYTALVLAGTRSGNLAGMLSQIASKYQAEVQRKVASFVGIIEPVLIGVLCVLVGLILFSVILPLFGILIGM